MNDKAESIHELRAQVAKLKCGNHYLRLAWEDEKKKAGKRGRDLMQLRKKYGVRK